MNRNHESFEASPTLDLHAAPVPLYLPVGAAIFALKGTVWITQERLRDDVVLSAGERFEVKSDKLILASAVKGTAAIHIVQPAVAHAHRQQDVYEFARARAHDLRREEIARLVALAVSAGSAWIARLRTTEALRPQTIGH